MSNDRYNQNKAPENRPRSGFRKDERGNADFEKLADAMMVEFSQAAVRAHSRNKIGNEIIDEIKKIINLSEQTRRYEKRDDIGLTTEAINNRLAVVKSLEAVMQKVEKSNSQVPDVTDALNRLKNRVESLKTYRETMESNSEKRKEVIGKLDKEITQTKGKIQDANFKTKEAFDELRGYMKEKKAGDDLDARRKKVLNAVVSAIENKGLAATIQGLKNVLAAREKGVDEVTVGGVTVKDVSILFQHHSLTTRIGQDTSAIFHLKEVLSNAQNLNNQQEKLENLQAKKSTVLTLSPMRFAVMQALEGSQKQGFISKVKEKLGTFFSHPEKRLASDDRKSNVEEVKRPTFKK